MLSKAERQFLELLQCGLWGTTPNEELFDQNVKWQEVYEMSMRQTVVGIVYDGITTLPKTLQPPRELILKWYGTVLQIEQANRRLNGILWEAVGRYRAAGLDPILLKGQGVGQYYRNPLHRQPGDIDLYFQDGYERANALSEKWEGVVFHEATSYHLGFEWHGAEIENHCVYVDFYSRSNKKALKKYLELVPLVGKETFAEGFLSVQVPSPQMNVIYLFLHTLHHFLQVGVGLRQVCDWLCLIKERGEEIDRQLFEESVDMLPVRRAMTALMYIGETYLGMPTESLPLYTQNTRKDGELMLRDILDMGNFGHDTVLWRSFRKGRYLKNAKAYLLALHRHTRIYRFCPSEVRAYPISWMKNNLLK